jgi:hypothetical protein
MRGANHHLAGPTIQAHRRTRLAGDDLIATATQQIGRYEHRYGGDEHAKAFS